MSNPPIIVVINIGARSTSGTNSFRIISKKLGPPHTFHSFWFNSMQKQWKWLDFWILCTTREFQILLKIFLVEVDPIGTLGIVEPVIVCNILCGRISSVHRYWGSHSDWTLRPSSHCWPHSFFQTLTQSKCPVQQPLHTSLQSLIIHRNQLIQFEPVQLNVLPN